MNTFKEGDTVESIPFGRKEAFVGTIVKATPGGYHIRDGFNKFWHRDESELTLVRKA